MIRNVINWIKNNKLTFALILVVLYLISGNILPYYFFNGVSSNMYESYDGFNSFSGSTSTRSLGQKSLPAMDSYMYEEGYAPTPDVQDRMVVTQTSLSLLVKDVRDVINKIGEIVRVKGGYVVNSRIRAPEEGAMGTISIRVPSNELNGTLEQLRGLSVKVVDENISGRDVTDQYVDIDSRLATLYTTKSIYENMLPQAVGVTQILEVQRHILQVQDQIDSLVGKQRYLRETSETVLITVNLSTDEYALPYAPENTWRPEVIFKQAVRSLVNTLRGLGSMFIWLGVYSVLIIPVLVVIYIIRRRQRRNL